MSGEQNLATLLATMQPVLSTGRFVFVSVGWAWGDPRSAGLTPTATIAEDEGLTLVLPVEQADAAGLQYDYLAARITLRVHSSLAAVGLTAAVAAALGAEGISCNVLAGYFHDHLYVADADAERAMQALHELHDRNRAGIE